MYDDIAQDYRTAARDLQMPLHRPELYTFGQTIGDVRGLAVLDLGCGEGFYTRRLRQLGAARVVGTDISAGMIALAQQEEDRSPLGIEYRVADVRNPGPIDAFDLVVSFFMLNHAESRDDLVAMCHAIAANLKPGGRFFGFNNNLDLQPADYPKIAPYGRILSAPELLVEGAPISITIQSNGEDCTFVDRYLSRATYEWAFTAAGLHALAWGKPEVSPADLARDGKAYWQNFIDHPTFVVLQARKSMAGVDR